jgi:signal transduction histidine kinase
MNQLMEPKEKGTGLGLIIAKDYIDRNNGEMYIQSEEGKGSVFSFTVGFVQTPVTLPS